MSTTTERVASLSSVEGKLPQPAEPDPPPGRPERTWLRWHLASLAVAGAALGYLNRDQWFFFDEWEFILKRGENPSLGLFTPHNEHWSTMPALVYKVLLLTVGLDAYWPYMTVLIVAHLALAHLVWRASMRAGASPVVATGVAGVFAVLGAGSANLLWAFQMGFVASATFGWLAVLLHDHDGPIDRRDAAGWVAMVTALMCCGPAVTFVGVAMLTTALRRRRWLDTVLVGAVPALIFAIWWIVAGRHNSGQVGQSGVSDVWSLVDYAWAGLTGMAQEVVGIPQSGAVLILALVLWWLRHPDAAAGRSSLVAAGAAGAFGFFVFTGGARADAGVQYASISRYVYIGAALLAPAVALALSRVTADTKGTRFAVLGLCAAVGLHNVGLLRLAVRDELPLERDVRRQMAAYDEFLDDGRRILPGQGTYVEHSSVQLTAELLPRLADYDWEPGVSLSKRDRLDAQLTWQVGFDDPDGRLGEAALSATQATSTPVSAGGCVDVDPVAESDSGADADPRSEVELVSDGDGLRVRVTTPGLVMLSVALRDGEAISERHEVMLASDAALDVVSYADDRTLVLTADQQITICGVATEDI